MQEMLYIFIDEGGDMNFSTKGTRYFTLTALAKIRPFAVFEPLINLKYDLWEKGIDFEYFHATEDSQITRDEVFKILSGNLNKFTVDTIIVEKRKTNPKLQGPNKFYQKIFEILLNYVLYRYSFSRHLSKVFIITATIPINKHRKEVEKAIQNFISLWSTIHQKSYKICHYSSKSDINLQIVDYFNWAIFRKWERLDCRSYDLIKKAIFSEFEVFRSGKIFYY